LTKNVDVFPPSVNEFKVSAISIVVFNQSLKVFAVYTCLMSDIF